MERQLSACAGDPWFFATSSIITFDESTSQWLEFPKYEYLKMVFEKIETPGDKYWLKSQRMLITISFCAYYLWAFLFEEGFNGFMTSKVQDAVDNIKAGWNSLFGKIRMMFDKLPDFMVEAQLGRRYHSSELINYMAATNPKSGNVIVGHAPTMSCGTGEGYTIALVDETASVYNMNAIHTNLTQSCRDNKNYVSFPLGKNNKFAEIHFKKKHFGFEKVDIDWSMNPRYTKEWYEKQAEKMTEHELAQRIDKSFEESTKGKVWKKFKPANNIRPVEVMEGMPIYLFWDFGFRDSTSVGLCQWLQPRLTIFDWYEINESDYREVSKALREKLMKYGYVFEENGYDSEGHLKYKLSLGSPTLSGYGDPQVKQTEIRTGLNLQISYGEQGFDIETCDAHQTVLTLDKIDKAFEVSNIIIDPRAEPIIEACRYWAWPIDTQGNQKIGATQPQHNQYSHAGKALEYGYTMVCMGGSSDMTGYLEEEDSGLYFEGIMEQQF
jgi:hypothetical protein